MKQLQKNWLLITKGFAALRQKGYLPFLFFICIGVKAQTANYVNNGGFEQYWSCTYPNDILLPKYWRTLDSLTDNSRYYNTCIGIQNVPIEGGQMQYPRNGNGFIGITNYCVNGGCNPNYNRSYARNRLKANLLSGEVYCVKFYTNLRNISTVAIDAMEACFTDNISLDTIINKNRPLTFLTAQIKNPLGNFLLDTMNWVLVSGTFTATGSESNLVIGNFKSNSATNTVQVSSGTILAADMFLDDVSCIPLNLPAYAAPGPNIWAIPGNTVYLGRTRDVGIDEACMWYKLPNTTNAIDTAAGITITVAATTETYMVKQDICGMIKYDTVVVHASALSINETLKLAHGELILSPNPAQDCLELKISNDELRINSSVALIYNSLGQLIREEEIVFKESAAKINTDDLNQGLYILTLKNNTKTVSKRFVIAR